MQNIEIVCVGRADKTLYAPACAEYEKRIAPFAKLVITELAETRLLEDTPAMCRRVIEEESERIKKHLEKKHSRVVAMCVEGKEPTSEDLAKLLRTAADSSQRLCFVIGGSLGLSQSLKDMADDKISLSRMTLPHQLARLVLLEQLYRACTINNNIRYHK